MDTIKFKVEGFDALSKNVKELDGLLLKAKEIIKRMDNQIISINSTPRTRTTETGKIEGFQEIIDDLVSGKIAPDDREEIARRIKGDVKFVFPEPK